MKLELRVKTNQEFQKVISGSKFANQCFVLYYTKNEFDHPRFGISASKKLGNAVIRSTTRRRVRAMINKLIKEKEIAIMDYVIIVRKQFLENSYLENLKELDLLFQRVWRKINEKIN